MVNKEQETLVAMALARRSYLFNLFHGLFGGAVDEGMTNRLFCDDTLDSLLWLDSLLDSDGSLSLKKLEESDRTLKECVEEAIACVREHADRRDLRNVARLLQGDYSKLFQIPGGKFIRPWESPYISPDGTLFCDSTLDVREFYHAAGFKLKAERHFPDDHIAAMMDYLARMSQRAYEAYADGDDVLVASNLCVQKRFCRNHLLTWIDEFADKVIRNDEHAYYAAFAGAMAAFVHVDCLLMERLERGLAAAE